MCFIFAPTFFWWCDLFQSEFITTTFLFIYLFYYLLITVQYAYAILL